MLMLWSGTDVKTVADRLGHESPITTLRMYLHASDAANVAAGTRIDDLLRDERARTS